MRIFLRCRGCERRYQVAEEKIGRRFRCHCGQVITVEEPKVHDSPVARCSSCGAAREADQQACIFCHSEFVLHERDLHTVCSQCLTRVSDRAKFCHSCGERLEAESVGVEDSEFHCPACGDRAALMSRRLGQESISVLECQLCAGLWIGHSSFDQLKQRAAERGDTVRGLSERGPRPVQQGQSASASYRPCVRCGELMARRQYVRGSGVIVDICRDHGIWFDDEELAQLLKWIAEGGHQRPEPTPTSPKPTPSSIPLELLRQDAFQPPRHSLAAGDLVQALVWALLD
jgi:Zn-finger nucleic acid-binding protein/predicted RNA-binding Zn-ribbon protein involved in translation (DUF1610 family)